MKTMTTLASLTLIAVACASACGGSPNPADVKAPEPPAATPPEVSPPTVATAAPDAGAAPVAAKPAPAEDRKDCHKGMFKKYGEAAFLKVNDSIIKKSLEAPEDKLGKTFKALAKKPKDIERVKKNLAGFLVAAYGGPADSYKGRPMEAVHAKMKITSEQYDWFVANVVVPALKENGVSEDDIKECFAPVVTDAATKGSIVGK